MTSQRHFKNNDRKLMGNDLTLVRLMYKIVLHSVDHKLYVNKIACWLLICAFKIMYPGPIFSIILYYNVIYIKQLSFKGIYLQVMAKHRLYHGRL